MSPATSTRWCPTTEQLMILEEMYKSGIRTPNATQIQQITSHLSFYGKIEGKNVFYWFQNHKARDRQKLRRKLITRSSQHQQQQMMSTHHDHHHLLHHHQASSTAACLQQFPHFNSSASTHFLHHPQEAAGMVLVQEEEPSHDQVMMMNNKWKFDNIPERVLVDQMMEKSSSSTTMMYGRDWMMMMDVDPTVFQYPACCNTNINKQPLKTLELFPVKSTNFKEECTTSNHNILSLSLQPPPNYQMMLHDHH